MVVAFRQRWCFILEGSPSYPTIKKLITMSYETALFHVFCEWNKIVKI